ncbi:MAG: GtrA family protein [Microbacter sp.]
MTKKSWQRKIIERFVIFLKAQISAMIGGVSDYFIMVFFTQVFHVHYTISIAIGGVIGAVINFSINKTWTFMSKRFPYKNSFRVQMLKFIVVVINSIVLKSSGTYFITTYLHLDYRISRIIVDLIVSIAFNYNLQKYWVFKQAKKINPEPVQY